MPRNDEDGLEALLAQQIVGLYVSSLGPSPAWFRRGAAWAGTARLVPRSDLVTGWNEQLSEAFTRQQNRMTFWKVAQRLPTLICWPIVT